MPPTDPATLLAGAEAARTRPAESAEAIARALKAAPADPDVRLAAYRFHFYNHDHAAALKQARVLLGFAARRLNISADWRDVRAWDAAFSAHDFAPGLYLQALVAIGYCAARLGQIEEAGEVLANAAELDPTDRFGGACLLARLRAVEED